MTGEPDETSGDDDDDEDDVNDNDIFGPDARPEPLRASDGKIIFSEKSAFVMYWGYFVIILAIYNSITIPISIFYGEDGHSMFGG